MAAGVSVRVDGLREFRRDIRKLDREVDKDLRLDIKDAAGPMLAEARASAPLRTGAYARSLRIGVATKGVSIYSTLPQAPVLHWGGTIAPRGVEIRFPRTEHITKAVERGSDRLVADIADSVERAARRTGWS